MCANVCICGLDGRPGRREGLYIYSDLAPRDGAVAMDGPVVRSSKSFHRKQRCAEHTKLLGDIGVQAHRDVRTATLNNNASKWSVSKVAGMRQRVQPTGIHHRPAQTPPRAMAERTRERDTALDKPSNAGRCSACHYHCIPPSLSAAAPISTCCISVEQVGRHAAHMPVSNMSSCYCMLSSRALAGANRTGQGQP